MTMMFEVQDLAVASPATVSRCGMVYLEPSILGLMPFVECWLKHLPSIIKPYEEQFKRLFIKYLEVGETTGTPTQRGGRGLSPQAVQAWCLFPTEFHQLRSSHSEGSDCLNQQQPDNEPPQTT